ncbi:MAG: DUF2877 domain-containing protein [Spirochaetaceae bacterium]|nr:MAG: DUF2877 domain-containing protein [Spirochaetaceae bacterium]
MNGSPSVPVSDLPPALRPPVARLVGAMVPIAEMLRVHSVFDRAVNLAASSNGALVSLVVRPQDMTATAVLVDRLPAAVAVGGPVVIGGFPAAGADGPPALRIACEGSARWEGRLGAITNDGYPSEGLAHRLEALVRAHGRNGGMLPLVSAAADTPVTRFARAALQSSGRPDWSRLVGLGIGLTPSGDDFLTGALLAERLLVAGYARPHDRGARHADAAGAASDGVSVDRTNLAARLGGTTAPGRTLLAAALEERFPAYLLSLVETAIAGGVLTADHLEHGHSSATDAVCGIIVRLRMEC